MNTSPKSCCTSRKTGYSLLAPAITRNQLAASCQALHQRTAEQSLKLFDRRRNMAEDRDALYSLHTSIAFKKVCRERSPHSNGTPVETAEGSIEVALVVHMGRFVSDAGKRGPCIDSLP